MAMMKERGQTYKLERLADIPEGEVISLYSCGDFTDLCRGPHVESTRGYQGGQAAVGGRRVFPRRREESDDAAPVRDGL